MKEFAFFAKYSCSNCSHHWIEGFNRREQAPHTTECPNCVVWSGRKVRTSPDLIPTSAETQQVAAKLAPHGGGQPNTLAEALAFIEYMAKELKAARRRLTTAEEVIGKQAKALQD
ncbi:hypothetical protein CMI37_19455 [Candidatus Pacearchaeota archaeon]|nr:hypothetical protein [Candidatus Pacearchaeota archaeon]|tara:strand:- start:287 stop:631 length:345 start_codon:yes stop_codon:yes gene_type:complete